MSVEQLSETDNLPEKELSDDSEDDPGSRGKTAARIKNVQETYNKDVQRTKGQTNRDVNNAVTETKNTLEGINNRVIETEKRMS